MIEIEKNVPIPSAFAGPHSRKYNFPEMEIGDSFAVKKADSNKLRSSVGSYQKINPEFKYTTRLVLENGNEFLRIWRIS